MKIPEVVTLDFETLPIQKRPDYPPKPVSMSIQMPHWPRPKFFAWAHLTGRNTCTWNDAKRILQATYDSGLPYLCHNSKFDLDILQTHFGVGEIPWQRIHDTQFLLFKVDPSARSLALKEAAYERLGIAPEERDSVRDWILEHKVQLESDFPEIVTKYGGVKPSTASAFIAFAPAEIVEAYCNGDVSRTLALFKSTYKEIVKRKMLPSYARELKLMPTLLANEREGVRVDLPRLCKDVDALHDGLTTTDAWLKKKLRAKNINLDSADELADALESAGLAQDFLSTPTGKRSTSIESLAQAITDKKTLHTLNYRSRIVNQTRNFLDGWLHQAEQTGGTIHTSWHQTRNSDGGGVSGTRTGRLSTDSPNLLAVTKKLGKRARDHVHPTWMKVPELPHLRSYLLPDEGCLWVRRDFSSQELRALSHFEGGALQQAYLENPYLDIHEFVRGEIKRIVGLDLERDDAKTVSFSLLYGQGLGALATKLGRSVDDARAVKKAYLVVLPGLQEIIDDLKLRDRQRLPIRTWGGSEIYSEEPRVIKGQMRDFAYKYLNTLIQTSAAECSKEALNRYMDMKPRSRFLALVHDETDVSTPKEHLAEEIEMLRSAMLSVEFDVPMLSEVEVGPSWGEVKKYDEPAPDLSRWAA